MTPLSPPPPLQAPSGRPAGGVTHPGSGLGHVATHDGHHNAGHWIGVGLVFLSLLALGVFLILPKAVEPTPATTPVAATPSPSSIASPTSAPPDAAAPSQTHAAQARLQTQLQSLLEQLLAQRAELELAAAPLWAETDWRALEEQKRAADQALDQKRLDAALEAYQGLTDAYRALDAARADYGQHWRERAATAYATENAAAAIAAWEKAQAALPEAIDIEAQRMRARRLDQVLIYMRSADAAAQTDDTDREIHALQAALALDPEYAPAAERLRALQAQRAAVAFRQAMSHALIALEQKRLATARNALDQAARLRPNDPAIASTRQRLQDAARQHRLHQHRRRALAAQAAEDWTTAQAEYRKALAIDAQNANAQDGLNHAAARLQFHAQLAHYLHPPERLYNPESLAQAERLLTATHSNTSDEPKLTQKLAQLRDHIRRAKTPIPLRLQSDGETDVTLRPVARLGRFQTHDLELRPGTYVLTGIRIGYRDVRQTLQIRPDQRPAPITIRCEERID